MRQLLSLLYKRVKKKKKKNNTMGIIVPTLVVTIKRKRGVVNVPTLE
jgi:hypothetical protein